MRKFCVVIDSINIVVSCHYCTLLLRPHIVVIFHGFPFNFFSPWGGGGLEAAKPDVYMPLKS
jgi:hypothetical protein